MQQKEIPIELIQLIASGVRLFMAQKDVKKAHFILITKILPLLERHPVCAQLKRVWEDEKAKRNEHETLVLRELSVTAKDILACVETAALNNHAVHRASCILNSMLRFRREDKNATPHHSAESSEHSEYVCNHCKALMWQHRPYVLPSYAYGLNEAIQALCREIVVAGSGRLLNGYVEIAHASEYMPPQRYQCMNCKYAYAINSKVSDDDLLNSWCCPKCGSSGDYSLPVPIKRRPVPYITRFMLAPSMEKYGLVDERISAKNNLNSSFRLQTEYELLCAFWWAWKIDRDFFRDKSLRYKNSKVCQSSRELLELHGMRSDVIATKTDVTIKKKTTGQKKKLEPLFLTPERIKEAVLYVMDELGVTLHDNAHQPIYPLSIKLVFEREDEDADEKDDKARLLIHVQWPSGIYELCLLHTFQVLKNSKNVLRDFADSLHENVGQFFKIDLTAAEGSDVTKYLERLGFTGALKKLLIKCKGPHHVQLKSTYIDLSTHPKVVLRQLCRQLGGFETIEWQFTGSQLSHK